MGFSDVRSPVKKLSDKEEKLIAYFKNLSELKKDLALAYLQGLVDAQKDQR